MSPVWLTGLSAWQAQQVAVSCLEQIITHRPGLSYALPQSGVSPDLPGKRLNPSQTLETSASTTSDAAGQPRHDHVTDLAGPAAHARAAETYARLAPLIGQTRYIRLSPDGGTSFPGQARHTRLLRPLLPQLPAQPCTVSVYDSDRGVGRLLVADLDVQRAIARGMTRHEAIAAVHDEAQALIELIERCGGRAISDRSPNGGRHVYVRFARALPWTDLRQLAYALALRFHTLDIWPMSSRHGQIRPPGALHKLEHGHLTGYMTLTLPLRDAEQILRRPCGPAVWAALHQDLTAELAALTQRPSPLSPSLAGDDAVEAGANDGRTCPQCHALVEIPLDSQGRPWLPRMGGRRALTAEQEQLARTGNWRARGAMSPSEARLGLLNSIAAAGWTYAETLIQMLQGPWSGLAVLLENKRLSYQMTRLAKDWRKAIAGIARLRHARSCNTSVRQPSTPPEVPPDSQMSASLRLYNVDSKSAELAPTTSTDPEHRRDANLWSIRTATPAEADLALEGNLNLWQQIRRWRTCILLAERDPERIRAWGRAAPSIRLLLRAIAVAARMDGSTNPAFGVRSLSEMCGLDYTVVSRHLRQLRDEDDPLIDLIDPAAGRRADRYGLRVPDAYRAEAAWIRFPAGAITSLHPALHALGPSAALVYEALSAVQTGPSELSRLARLARSTTCEALRTLAAYQLAAKGETGWMRGERDLGEAAVELGADVTKTERHARYVADRKAWWELLEAWELPPMDRPAHLRSRRTRDTDDHAHVTAEALSTIPWPTAPTDGSAQAAYDNAKESTALTGATPMHLSASSPPPDPAESRPARWPDTIPGRPGSPVVAQLMKTRSRSSDPPRPP
ncbi:hypothetical protein OG339_48290 (plasmid) [Streptosporangium sp. NBC_01495]|uniref:hypothetical protein n=1 Tax=Streptosporangium sp. NBC_01495 TaxID=2903899 RepID=UPI002E375667|nr:hypothetical protein [Streptosporangium sp. NBC_01495]